MSSSVRPPQATKTGRSRRGVPVPQFVPPQLSQSVDKPPSGPKWVHEIKLDGFRMAARIDNGRLQLLTRTGLDWTGKYPAAVAAVSNVNVKAAYLDGELCGVDDAGLPSFAQTQAATDGERAVHLVYYAFDILHLCDHVRWRGHLGAQNGWRLTGREAIEAASPRSLGPWTVTLGHLDRLPIDQGDRTHDRFYYAGSPGAGSADVEARSGPKFALEPQQRADVISCASCARAGREPQSDAILRLASDAIVPMLVLALGR